MAAERLRAIVFVFVRMEGAGEVNPSVPGPLRQLLPLGTGAAEALPCLVASSAEGFVKDTPQPRHHSLLSAYLYAQLRPNISEIV